MKTPSCQKPFREKDVAVLRRVCEGGPGNIWRQPLIEAMKRAGAQVHTDPKKRLCVVFGEHAMHISRLDCGLAEDFPDAHGELKALAQDLLQHKGIAAQSGFTAQAAVLK